MISYFSYFPENIPKCFFHAYSISSANRYPEKMKLHLAIVAFALPICSIADTNFIPIRNHRSTSLNFLRPLPLGKILNQDSIEKSFHLAISNEMRNLPAAGIYEDSETWRFAYRYRKSLKNKDELFFEAPFLYRGGGILDPILAWWHRIFVDDSVPLRDNTPFGQSELQIPGGQYSSGFGIGDLTIAYGRTTSIGATRIWTKLPTGNPKQFFGSGNFDFGISIDNAWKIAPRWTTELHLGLTAQGKPSQVQNARGIIESAAINISYQPNRQDSFSLQWNSEASPTNHNRSFTDSTHRVISLGYTKKSSRDKLSIYFQEDGDFGWFDFPGGAQIGPDWTMGLNYTIFK